MKRQKSMVDNNLRYEEYGYANRDEYLVGLADEYDVDVETVFAYADLLSENEDFDGLVCALEDISFTSSGGTGFF
jgi:hypothetical protein